MVAVKLVSKYFAIALFQQIRSYYIMDTALVTYLSKPSQFCNKLI